MSKFTKLSRSNSDKNTAVKNKIISELGSLFPIEGNFFILEATNFQIKNANTGMSAVKKAIDTGGSILSSVTADVKLIDKNSKKILDRKNRVVMRIPDFTSNGAFVVDGNSYTVPFQQRLQSGAYTLRKGNDEISTMFNLSKGRNFDVKMDQKTGEFKVKVGSSHSNLYSILHDSGVDDKAIRAELGDSLFENNKKKYKQADSLKFLTNFTYGKKFTEKDGPIHNILNTTLNETVLNRDIMNSTLGVDTDKVTPIAMLKSAKRVLDVTNGKKSPDDRENMMYKQIMTPEASISEAFKKKSRDEITKIKFKLNNPDATKIDDILGAGSSALTRPIKMFLSSSKLSRLSEEYNPLMKHMANHWLTPMGEGGVGDTRALSAGTKAIHPSQLGFVDPIVSPEGATVGITLSVTGNSYVDENGRPAMGVINAKTGKKEVKLLSELWKKKVSYPTSEERIKTDGIHVRLGHDDLKAKNKNDVDYVIESASDLHSPSTNYLALMNSMDANRANMGQKHVQQASSLEHREVAHVSTSDRGVDYAETMMKESEHLPVSKEDGTVTKITKDTITVKGSSGNIEYDFVSDMPLARKTYIHHTPSVKIGDKVKKGQNLADSNYSKEGKAAFGVNIRTAWLSIPGNRNDGVVMSERAAEQFTSNHMYKEIVAVSGNEELNMKKFQSIYPQTVSKFGITAYDSYGIIKKGQMVEYNQPLVYKLKKVESKQIKSKLAKLIGNPLQGVIDSWHHKDTGEIVSVQRSNSEVRISIKIKSKAQVGDKLSGRYGNKGVITRITSEDNMPKNEKGEPVHLLLTSAGIVSRVNGGSITEAGLGKIVDKTKKRYVMDHYSKSDNHNFMEAEAKKHKVEMYETLINPETGKPFPKKIFVGNPYIMKLFKDSESSMSAVGVAGTDVNQQPMKGGKDSASAISNMEINALLAHGAKNFLREVRDVKGQKNDEYFNAFKRGLPTPPPSENFASSKFNAYLTQLGVNVHENKETSTFSLTPMTNTDVLNKSSGRIRNSETISAKNKTAIKGGLFDDSIFGGPDGSRFGHIKLSKRILNPMFKDQTASLLGITGDKVLKRIDNGDTEAILKEVNAIDPQKRLEALKKESLATKNPQVVNRNIKAIRFLDKIVREKKKISDFSSITNIPVIPPKFRPVTIDDSGDVSINDLNLHYQEIDKLSEAIQESKGIKAETKNMLTSDLYKTVGALYGVEQSPNKKIVDKGIKGVLDILGGETPKKSFTQQNLLRKKQFMSGRATIMPARTDIDIDHIEIPVAMGLKMYEPHISRDFSKAGFTQMQIKEMIEKKDKRALNKLDELGKAIPVAYNRPPTLWRHNFLGAYPKFIKGSTIGVNFLTERSMNSDYDGDAIAVHVPITRLGAEDIRTKMMPSQNLLSDQKSSLNPDVVVAPDQDSTLGMFKATRASDKKPRKVKNIAELNKLINSGDVNYNDLVII